MQQQHLQWQRQQLQRQQQQYAQQQQRAQQQHDYEQERAQVQQQELRTTMERLEVEQRGLEADLARRFSSCVPRPQFNPGNPGQFPHEDPLCKHHPANAARTHALNLLVGPDVFAAQPLATSDHKLVFEAAFPEGATPLHCLLSNVSLSEARRAACVHA